MYPKGKILLQVALPGVIVGTLLLATCAISAWYIDRVQSGLAHALSKNVNSLKAAQELEIRVEKFRFHGMLYLMDPTPVRLAPIEKDHQAFREALELARKSSAPTEQKLIKTIESGYHKYLAEWTELRQHAAEGKPQMNLAEVADKHPIRHVVDPCQQLVQNNKDTIAGTVRDSENMTIWVHRAMILLGVLGPLGGLGIGFFVARRLSRSIYRLSVRVQDITRHLDQSAASVTVTADEDLEGLDRQLQHIFRRIEEIAERLQQHQRSMLRAEQLSAVGQLAAGVAHEIRNPLTAIKMLVEAALRPGNTKPLTAADLHVIHGEVVRLEDRVQGFLNFARLPTPQRDTFDVREIVRAAIDLVRARAGHQKVELITHGPADPVLASLDREQIRTVLVNLFLNALDAMPQGGRLTVDTTRTDGKIVLAISDTGNGIAPEMQERLFTPFASSKPTGTGLGLSLSRRIVEEHGGSISAENRAQGGACFTIELAVRAGSVSDGPD